MTEEPQWRRAHRVTPFLTAWKVAAAIIAIALFQVLDDLLRAPLPVVALVGIVLGFVVLAALISLGYSYLAWRRLSYAVTADAVVLRSGVVFRRERVARLTRLQSVEITQPILGRIFGFSALRIESAGGADANLVLSYLTQAEAQAVRNEVLARAAGVAVVEEGSAPAQAGEPAEHDGAARLPLSAPEAPELEVFRLAPQRLVLSLLLHPATVTLVVIIALFVTLAVVLHSIEWIIGPAAGVLGLAGFLWSRFAGEFAFRVATSPDGLRARQGLLETKARTIPPGRVQSVELSQGLLWRGPGWWRVEVSLASLQTAEGGVVSNALLPVGTAREALELVRLAIPDLQQTEQAALEAGLTGSGSDHGWIPSPPRAVWLDPISFRRNAFQVLGSALALRRGRLHRRFALVPHERTQSLGISQGPLERVVRLVGFHPHTSAAAALSLPHLDPGVAARLLAEQSERARSARRSAGPELWMQRTERVGETAEHGGELAPEQGGGEPGSDQGGGEPGSDQGGGEPQDR